MDLKELKLIWEKNGFRPRKKLGQNFLTDRNIRDKIIKHLDIDSATDVLEIGAGFGAMTLSLSRKCARVIAVEKDRDVCESLRHIVQDYPNVQILEEDVMNLDLADIAHRKKIAVYGNIPYYISSPLIEMVIESREHLSVAYLVMQKELAERLVAVTGTKDYSSLTCYVNFYGRPRKLFNISANVFYPRPKVDSALVEIKLPEKPSVKVEDEKIMFGIIRKAFTRRRKKITNSLPAVLCGRPVEWGKMIEKVSLDPFSRAGDLTLSDYARLSDSVTRAMGRE